MKLNKQILLLSFILIIGITAYILIPNFEREEFNPNVVEDISSGNITTTTIEEVHRNDENVSTNPNDTNEEAEIFETNIYDQLLVNNESRRIDDLFTSYLVIGSDERTSSSSESRGSVKGSRADVILIAIVDKNSRQVLSVGDIIRRNDLKTLSKVFKIKKSLSVLTVLKRNYD